MKRTSNNGITAIYLTGTDLRKSVDLSTLIEKEIELGFELSGILSESTGLDIHSLIFTKYKFEYKTLSYTFGNDNNNRLVKEFNIEGINGWEVCKIDSCVFDSGSSYDTDRYKTKTTVYYKRKIINKNT